MSVAFPAIGLHPAASTLSALFSAKAVAKPRSPFTRARSVGTLANLEDPGGEISGIGISGHEPDRQRCFGNSKAQVLTHSAQSANQCGTWLGSLLAWVWQSCQSYSHLRSATIHVRVIRGEI